MNAAIATTPALDTEKRDEFAGRLFESTLGALDLVTVYLGEHLGLYRALVDRGASTSAELAHATGTTERYAREWLEQQAASAIVEVDDARLPARRRRYTLPPEHAEVLLDSDSLAYVGPLGRLVVGMAKPVRAIGEAFRSGGGVPWEAYGDDVRTAQADFNRPQFLNLLASEWLPAMPDVHERLQADPPAHVADIACGAGWSSIAIAKGYPKVTVEGFDLDAPSIDAAHVNALRAGVSDRVRFFVADAAETALEGHYDLVTVFEALHDMSRPVDALHTMHRLVAKDGAVLVMDERVAEAFELPTSETERFLYQCSVLLCLPNGMAEQPSAATGTVMREETMRRYAEGAGFASVTVLPIEHELFRFYRLKP